MYFSKEAELQSMHVWSACSVRGVRAMSAWLSAADAEADLADFEAMLEDLARLEGGCWAPGEPLPRVHFWRQLVFECLVPWSQRAPEVVDAAGFSQDASQRTHMRHRVAALLEALLASQTLHLGAAEVRAFGAAASAEEKRGSAAFLRLAQGYRAAFGRGARSFDSPAY